MKKNPNDKNARLQFEQCQKIVKRDAFLKAIEVGDLPSAAEGLDVDAMVVEDSYDGVRLDGNEMTKDFVDDMIERFKNGKKIHRKYVFQIVLAVKDLVTKEPTMVETEIESDAKLTVCGDTHGMAPLKVSLDQYLLTLPTKANFLIYLKFSGSTATHPLNIITYLMATLLIVDPGQQR